jgi:hypothetical protein
MPANDYHFITHWRVRATPPEVWEILDNPLDLPRWWPSVYLKVTETTPGVYLLHTKGWLPYTLTWSLKVTERHYPNGFTLEAWGDFNGAGIWTFTAQDAFTAITYDWRIRADKPLLRYFSFAFKPFFSVNHRWAMARGEESLLSELVRRRSVRPA